MHSSIIHVKLQPAIAQGLKSLSKKRSVPVGELVRQAVSKCYQLDFIELTEKQRRALAAYQGEYISIGKLSEEMGMPLTEIRQWLTEHDLHQNNVFADVDIKNAR